MIGVLVAIALVTLIGAACTRLIDQRAPIGLWHLYGCGAVALALLWLPWSRPVIILATVVALVVLAWKRTNVVERPKTPRLSPIDGLTAVVLALFGFFGALSPLWEWDAWAIWALKGRVFFESRGVDWRFLESEYNRFAHPDYPLLVPVDLAFPAILTGSWDDRWLALMQLAILVSGVMALRSVTARMFSPAISAAMALTLAALGASPYAGTAETPLIVFAVTALAFLHAGEWTHGAILLGLAAMTKNEGASLAIAAAVALLLCRRYRNALRLWPAFALQVPWLVSRATHDLSTDVFGGALIERVSDRIGHAGVIVTELRHHLVHELLWIVALAVAVIVARRAVFPILTTAVQAAACIAIYFITPYDPAWHIEYSWDRVSQQLLAMLVFAALAGLAASISARSATRFDSEHPLE